MNKLDIDKYLRYYRTLCEDLTDIEQTRALSKRYLFAGWYLHTRHIKAMSEADKTGAPKSKQLSQEFIEYGTKLEQGVKELDNWFLPKGVTTSTQKKNTKTTKKNSKENTTTPPREPIIHIVPYAEWLFLEQSRRAMLSYDIEEIEKKFETSVLPQKMIIENKLNELLKKELNYLEWFTSGQPLSNGAFDLALFIADVNTIDFINYLVDLLQPPQVQPTQTETANEVTDTNAQQPEKKQYKKGEALDIVGEAFRYNVWQSIVDRTATKTEAFNVLAKVTGVPLGSVRQTIYALETPPKKEDSTHKVFQQFNTEKLEVYRKKVPPKSENE